MAIRDVFRRHSDRPASDDGPPAPAPEADAAPGSVSSPRDVGGRGPVTLADRTAHGGQGSPDTNQASAEPMPATPGEPDPTAPLPAPSLEDMNVGGADPQSPSHPAARDRDLPLAPMAVAHEDRGGTAQVDMPAVGAPGSGQGAGPERPAQASDGTAQRAPGSQGASPEQQDTDVQAGAANMRVGGGPATTPPPVEQPGDAQGVPVPHEVPAPGTSEQSPIVHGARSPQPPGP